MNMELVACIGQSLMGILFVIAALVDIRDYRPLLGLMQKKQILYPKLLLPIAIALKFFGGLFIALNVYVVLFAFLLAGFILVANVIFHPFWKCSGLDRKKEFTHFLTHLFVIAGLLILTGF